MNTAYDFLKNIFNREYELFLNRLTQDYSIVHNPGKKQLQWDVIFNEQEGMITVIAEKVDESSFPSRLDFELHCHFALMKDMCELFGWTKCANYQSTIVAKHGPNLVMKKRDTKFVEDCTDSQHYGYRCGYWNPRLKGVRISR